MSAGDALPYEIVDHGAFVYDELDDYPDFIGKAAAAVAASPVSDRAIIFGGSGQGEAMLANRYPGVRATVFYGGDESIVSLSREHNDANVLSFGARFVEAETVKRLIVLWLQTDPSPDPKYVRRIQKVEKLSRHPTTI